MRRTLSFLLAAAAIGGLGACSLRQPAPEWNGYLVAPARPTTEAEGSAGRLHVEAVTVAPAFAGHQLIVRRGEYTYEPDFYQRFLAPPDEMARGALVSWLGQAGFAETAFRVPAEAVESVPRLEAHVAELYADARAGRDAAAVLTLDVRVSRPDAAAPSLDRRYTERIPVPAATAEAMVVGLNDALGRILARLEADLRALR